MEEIYNKYHSEAFKDYFSDEIFIKYYNKIPKFRDYTFNYCINYFKNKDFIHIVELGTTRSFVEGKFKGCLKTDLKYWEPNNLEKWDWGAGIFTKHISDILLENNKNFLIDTVDISKNSLFISQTMTNNCNKINFHEESSIDFLKKCKEKSIDLLYLDTGNMNETTAILHKEESEIIIKNNILKDDGLILIDDVKNPHSPFSRKNLGKSKYSIPNFLKNGYEYVIDEYQVILKKTK